MPRLQTFGYAAVIFLAGLSACRSPERLDRGRTVTSPGTGTPPAAATLVAPAPAPAPAPTTLAVSNGATGSTGSSAPTPTEQNNVGDLDDLAISVATEDPLMFAAPHRSLTPRPPH